MTGHCDFVYEMPGMNTDLDISLLKRDFEMLQVYSPLQFSKDVYRNLTDNYLAPFTAALEQHPVVGARKGWIVFCHILGSIIVGAIMFAIVTATMGCFFFTRTYMMFKFTTSQLFFLQLLFESNFQVEES